MWREMSTLQAQVKHLQMCIVTAIYKQNKSFIYSSFAMVT